MKGGEKYGDKGKTSKMENWIIKMETKQCSKLNQRLTQGRKTKKKRCEFWTVGLEHLHSLKGRKVVEENF